MANSGAHRQSADLINHHHHHHSTGASSASNVFNNNNNTGSSANNHRSPTKSQFGHLIGSPDSTPSSSSKAYHHHKGHQRRQSVARLLPDISKLRLLSWLVEASNELINCDIAIMDGVYAKLNRSRESLLFWQHGSSSSSSAAAAAAAAATVHGHMADGGASIHCPPPATASQTRIRPLRPPPPPPPPSVQPVADKYVISQQQQQASINSNNKSPRSRLAGVAKHESSSRGARTHYSLPSANYDACSLAAVSWRSNKTMPTDRNSVVSSDAISQQASSLIISGSAKSANKIKLSRSKQQQQQRGAGQPIATTAAAAAQQPGCSSGGGGGGQEEHNLDLTKPNVGQKSNNPKQQQPTIGDTCELGDYCDSNDASDDDANSSAASSSTTSSGIHATSLSLESSASSPSSASSSASSSVGSFCSNSFDAQDSSLATPTIITTNREHVGATRVISSSSSASCSVPVAGSNRNNATNCMSSAEYLSERIRQTVLEHNYLQSLLVNIIRQHDKKRDQFNQQRRRHTASSSMDRSGLQHHHHSQSATAMPRIDLADIADSLDDGCQCCCHSERRYHHHQSSSVSYSKNMKLLSLVKGCEGSGGGGGGNLSTAATPTSSSLNLFQPAASTPTSSRKSARRSKKVRGQNEPSREDIIQQLADKLCENCFETHFWLQGCHSIESTQQQQPTSSSSSPVAINPNELNAIVSLRNATFIQLVQQQVRSTISKSIELIDLIRKEIKSPESIRQKQLMRCFSTSIQLLSSVANYVVPSQDISSFIPPEMEQQQTSLFSLPPNDFDHLLLYPTPVATSASSSNVNASSFPITISSSFQQQTNGLPTATNYHLAAVPEIPPRRRQYQQLNHDQLTVKSDSIASKLSANNSASLPASSSSHQRVPTNQSNPVSHKQHSNLDVDKDSKKADLSEQALSSNLQKLDTNDNNNINRAVDSSSGASSNNSSASSSIARGQVQQSSLTRAPPATTTASAILDRQTSHDRLTFETIASLSRHQTEDDSFGQTRPKFWQSSKFNFIKKLLHVKQQRILRQQSKDRRIYNNKVQNKFRLVMMDLTHFNKSQQLLTTQNGVNSLLTSMRNVLEFGLYLTLKLY